jgi:hypothetical protein
MSITDAMKQNKARKHIQQALWKDPNDVDSLLELAALHDGSDLDQKRKILHRILYLEPAHRTARQMLLEMDRREIGGDSRLSLAVILTDRSVSYPPEAPLTLRYSIVHQILVYLFAAGTVIAGLAITRDATVLAAVTAFLLIACWFVSVMVEISDSGLQISHLFGMVRSEIPWREIRGVNPAALGQGIRITHHQGKAVVISAHINGYPFILDILQQKRPDLFPLTEVAITGDLPHNDPAIISPETETFK